MKTDEYKLEQGKHYNVAIHSPCKKTYQNAVLSSQKRATL
ncbi:hypothetical protein SMIDD26_02008 [Streptococcus mitis]|uniref:Uncharacterized protein n=1 Tax=Streptococcus mitis TaxID=28037 RepID=A0A139PK57_STRMT|nr:hypothetical protein SMIDD26_02008 [Streptococcus mitis]